MWVFEEQVEGGKLTDVINQTNENVKYLPGVKLGENVRALPDLREVVQGSTALVMVSPHQFLKKICNDVSNVVDKNATAVSLIKGMDITPAGPQLLSTMVREHLGIDCSVLMGANIAKDVAKEEFSEATIGYRNKEAGRNRKVAEAFVASGGQKTWEVLESELLNGQKLQGVLTSHEVQQVIVARQWEKRFPLFTTIHKIASQELPPSAIIDYRSVAA
eukprot:jgi/Pico_ML_1/51701/g271.t1